MAAIDRAVLEAQLKQYEQAKLQNEANANAASGAMSAVEGLLELLTIREAQEADLEAAKAAELQDQASS